MQGLPFVSLTAYWTCPDVLCGFTVYEGAGHSTQSDCIGTALMALTSAHGLLVRRANNVRKKRSRAARMHHDRVMMRTALHGWAARVLLSEHLKQTLRKVAHEVSVSVKVQLLMNVVIRFEQEHG